MDENRQSPIDVSQMPEEKLTGASKEGVVRWVLGISTFLAIALLSVIWITGALTTEGIEEEEQQIGGYEGPAPSEESRSDGQAATAGQTGNAASGAASQEQQ